METLSSDHWIIRITLRTTPLHRPLGTARLTVWIKFRQEGKDSFCSTPLRSLEEWAREIKLHASCTQKIAWTETTPDVDGHLTAITKQCNQLVI